MRLLMIIPTYNEQENIVRLLTGIMAQPGAIEVVVVDDNSPDGTAAKVKATMARHPRIKLIEREGKLGLGTAYRVGMKYGLQHGYDLIGTMDADFSHEPKYIPAMAEAAGGADLVIGSRYVPDGGTVNWGVHRQLLSGCANAFARLVLGFRTHDNTAGFRIYKRSLLKQIDLDGIRSNGYSFLVEMLYRCNRLPIRVTEVPIIFVDRQMGKSKISKQEIFKAVMTVIRLRVSG